MVDHDRLDLVAPCGIDCGVCELHLCAELPQLFARLVAGGIPRDRLPCPGCRPVEGDCPVIEETCETYRCVTDRGVEFCFECAQFPCGHLHPSAQRADVLPHNMKVFNLCTIRRDGVAAFVEASPSIKRRYYQGRMEIGKGPQG